LRFDFYALRSWRRVLNRRLRKRSFSLLAKKLTSDLPVEDGDHGLDDLIRFIIDAVMRREE